MLIKLGNRDLRALGSTSAHRFVGRITEHIDGPGRRSDEILLTGTCEDLPEGYRAYLIRDRADQRPKVDDVYAINSDLAYLAEGDVIRIDPSRNSLHALYRRSSLSNSFLVTERCDNYCVMCSQPPKTRDDSWLVDELIDEVIPLVSPQTRELGITGGEPSLLRGRLVDLISACKAYLPDTVLHILSNGRSFANEAYAKQVASVQHPDLMIGIPLYADVPEVHDYVVQAGGAFDETVRGVLNLKQHGVRVELRFVIHAGTAGGLLDFARFVTRNLLFVDHVALMGLELMGFARANLDAIWIDPLDYQAELRRSVELLDRAGLRVSIYNHALCILDPTLHRFARASISDWKNLYLEECEPCALRMECGGLFASSRLRRSRGIATVVR